MRIKIRRVAALALAIAAIVCLASCSDADTGDALTFMGKKSDLEKPYMQTIFRRYEDSTGRSIKVIAYEDSEFEAAAAEKFAAGEGPDILMHFHNAELGRFNEDDFLMLDGESWVSELTDSARNYCTDSEGRLVGFPFWENSVSGCYYNKTLLEKTGLLPASTQADFDTLCQTLLTDMRLQPICWPADRCTWMFQFGLDPVFADDPELLEKLNAGEVSYSDIPAVTQMAQWVSDAAGNGWFGDDYLRTGWGDISGKLSSGRAVMVFIWDTWFYTDFVPGEYTVEDFALMPVFMGTADAGTYEGGNLNMMMVNKNAAHLDEALEFLRFCAMPENYNAAFDGISTVNCFVNQTTNIQSKMVTDAAGSIAANERVSTAASRIQGYSAEDVASAFDELLRGRTTPSGCVELMDNLRLEQREKQGLG